MNQAILKYNNKRWKDAPLQERELHLQKDLKIYHSEMNFGIRYSIKFYRKYSPEMIEKKWKEEIENLTRVVHKYQRRLAELEKEA